MSHSLSTVTRSVLIALLGGGVLLGCQKGPAQETGAKVDKAIDKLTGKGPAESESTRP